MTTVRIVSSLARSGRDYWGPGDLYECDPAEASRLIRIGTAEAVEVETAAVAHTRTTARPKAATKAKKES